MRILTNITALITNPGAVILNIEAFRDTMSIANIIITLIVSILAVVSTLLVIRNSLDKRKLLKIDKELKELELKDKLDHANLG